MLFAFIASSLITQSFVAMHITVVIRIIPFDTNAINVIFGMNLSFIYIIILEGNRSQVKKQSKKASQLFTDII